MLCDLPPTVQVSLPRDDPSPPTLKQAAKPVGGELGLCWTPPPDPLLLAYPQQLMWWAARRDAHEIPFFRHANRQLVNIIRNKRH